MGGILSVQARCPPEVFALTFGEHFSPTGSRISPSMIDDWWEIFAQRSIWSRRVSFASLETSLGGKYVRPGAVAAPQHDQAADVAQLSVDGEPIWHTVLGKNGRMAAIIQSHTVTLCLTSNVRSTACKEAFSHTQCARCNYPADAPLAGTMFFLSLTRRDACPPHPCPQDVRANVEGFHYLPMGSSNIRPDNCLVCVVCFCLFVQVPGPDDSSK